jgi:uncharacterized protein YbaR (Trm112 family)
MVDQTLLDILVCPETKQPLRPADDPLLERLNAAIREGTIVNRGGATVTEDVAEALVRLDERYLYPVRDGIPIMLIDEGEKWKDTDVDQLPVPPPDN